MQILLLYSFLTFYYTYCISQLFNFELVHRRLFILSSVTLIILPKSFFVGLISRAVGLLKKLFSWSFKVMKQTLFLLISIRSYLVLRVLCYQHSAKYISVIVPLMALRNWFIASTFWVANFKFIFLCVSTGYRFHFFCLMNCLPFNEQFRVCHLAIIL